MRLTSNDSLLTWSNEHTLYSNQTLTKVFVTCSLSVFIVFTIVGNILTLFAVFKLKLFKNSISNLYIASLAGADLLVGLCAMPFMMLHTVTYGGNWPFGNILCDIWQCIDYITCTISLYSVCAMGFDRWLNLEKPLRIFKRNKSVARKAIALIWILPVLIWVPVFVGLRMLNGRPWKDGACYFDWEPKFSVLLVAIPVLYVPVLILVVLFVRISAVIHQHLKFLQQHSNQDSLRSSLRQVCCDRPASSRNSMTPIGKGSRMNGMNVSNGISNRFALRRKSASPQISMYRKPEGLNPRRKSRRGSLPPQVVENIAAHLIAPASRNQQSKMSPPQDFYEKISAFEQNSNRSSPGEIRLSVTSSNRLAGLSKISAEDVPLLHQKIQEFRRKSSTELSRTKSQLTKLAMPARQLSKDSVGSFHESSEDSENTAPEEIKDMSIKDCGNKQIQRKDKYRSSIASDTALEIAKRMFRPKPLLARAKTSTIFEIPHVEYSAYGAMPDNGLVNPRLSLASLTSTLFAGRRLSLNMFSEMLPCNNISQQIRAGRAVGVMLLCFLICWLPFLVSWPLKTYCSDCVPPISYHLAIWANYLNSALNPVVYVMCSPRFQNVFRRLLCQRRSLKDASFTVI